MIVVHRYSNQYRPKWDQFIARSNNGTLFHYRDFLIYHLDRTFIDHSLIFTSKSGIIAVFPAAEVIDGEDRVLYSHPGASFGGFITGICAIQKPAGFWMHSGNIAKILNSTERFSSSLHSCISNDLMKRCTTP